MSLHRLLFDTANPAESANVGAYLRAGTDGTQIGSVSDALKVNFTNTSLAVTATDLDIRDLAFATDSVDVSGSSVSITGSVTVTATDLDIRDLSAASDSVESWLNDGSGNAITSTGGALDVNITNAGEVNIDFTHNTALAAASQSVTTTSAALIASPLANRENIFIYNNGSKVVYVGPSGVTTGTGMPIFPGSLLEAKIGPSVAIHAVAQSGSQDIRTLEMS